MGEILIALSIMCGEPQIRSTTDKRRKCVAEMLRCIDGKPLAYKKIAECIEPKQGERGK